MGGNSGSTIQARGEVASHLFLIILVVAIIIIAFFCIYFISKAITKYLNSPAYIEKKKSKPTSIKDINEVSAACNLVKEEKDILWNLCKINKTPNIRYLVNETEEIDFCMKELFKMYDEAGNEEAKKYLFSMRKKILSVYNNQIIIKNTKLIDPETVFTYTAKKGFHHKFTLKENNSEGLVLKLPSSLTDDEMPKSLDKINLVFEIKDGTPYNLESRVIRFQDGKEGKEVFLIHSDKISPLQKREQERAEVNFPCKFNSVKVSVEAKKKKEEVIYTPSEKDYEGTLEDISAGGCRLATNLPIKAEQYIHITGPFNGKQQDKAIGIIVRTTKRCDNVFILHVRFLKIELQVVNRIQAMVNHYD